jgi:hypothetical protein
MGSKHRYTARLFRCVRLARVVVSVQLLSILGLLFVGQRPSAANGGVLGAARPVAPPLSATPTAPAGVQVTLSAADTSLSWNSRVAPVVSFYLPVLYLHHERLASAAQERTLNVSISGLMGGVRVELEALSWHTDRATWEPHRQAQRTLLPDRACTAAGPCVVRWTLDANASASDLYRLLLRDAEGETLWANPDPAQPDFVALDTWQVGVGDYALRVIYGALFPFARGEKALYHRLAPDQVHSLVAGQILPVLLEVWRTQLGSWGFGPIHPDWDADKVVELIVTPPPYALFGGTGTYTVAEYGDGTPYPERRIWLLPNHNTFQAYDTLENGLKVILAHEFHHLVQRNVLLWTGCPACKWTNLFIEGQANMASSVQYPELELSRQHLVVGVSEYSAAAGHYLASGLERSYASLGTEGSVYDAALYWRFLYERYGSMRILRTALEEMACRPVDEVAATLDEIMDAAMARTDGPFATFEGSMVAFAEANYALRLADGRCRARDPSTCDGRYHDPEGMYPAPTLAAELPYDGSSVRYAGSIAASYGADLIEIPLDAEADAQPLSVVLQGEGAQFSVRAWRLRGKEGEMQALTPHPEALSGDCRSGCRYTIRRLDPERYDRLALIVVRLDPHERADPVGAYRITIEPTF